MISTFDLKLIHEIFKDIKTQYQDKSVSFQFFSATCLYLNVDIKLDFILKNRPYDSLIGIDNSSLDKRLKKLKFFKLHALLHNSAGYLQEKINTGHGYTYVLPCPIKSCYLGHMTGVAFYFFLKAIKPSLFHLLQC